MESIKENRRVFSNDMDRGISHNAMILIDHVNHLLDSFGSDPHRKNSIEYRGKDILTIKPKTQYQRMMFIYEPPVEDTKIHLGGLHSTMNNIIFPSPVANYDS